MNSEFCAGIQNIGLMDLYTMLLWAEESSKVTFFMFLPPQAPGERKLGR
jgi:hypothetical protein